MIFQSRIKKIYKKANDNILIIPFKRVYDFYRYRIVSDRTYLRRKYKEKFGRYPDLESPKLFTEKLQWLKLYDRFPLKTICADKYAVRDFVKERIGDKHLIPLVFVTEEVEDINRYNIPDFPVIIKVNHDSGGTMIVNDKNEFDFKGAKKSLKESLKTNYYWFSKEWEYKNIRPKIIIEKLMQDGTGNNLLNDYKIYCFNGEPAFIQTLFDRESLLKETWYNLNWEKQEFYYFSKYRKDVPRPSSLSKMIEVARKLSQGFKYVRVDLYDVGGEVFFGEMTFHPLSGMMKWEPPIWDKKLGDLLKL